MVHHPRNPQSPRGWRNNEAGGIGLGIAVALEKTGHGINQRKLHSTAAPIAVSSPRTSPGIGPKGCPEIHGFSCCDPPTALVAGEFYVADFLRDCFVCRKKLHGKDIFMYREKAFCSTECRHQQIMSDEYREKYGAQSMKRSPEIASSPCAAGQLFFTAGIEVS